MKMAVNEKDYDSRSRVQGGDYQGIGEPPKMGKLRDSFMNAGIPQKSKTIVTSPKKIG